MPSKRAELPGLQRFEHPQGLLNASPHGQVVDQLVLKDAVGIDDEKAAQRYPFFSCRECRNVQATSLLKSETSG